MSIVSDRTRAVGRLAAARHSLVGPPGDSQVDRLVELAYHASVPVAVDGTFIHLLRVNFLLDPPSPLPYEAEAALLLSPLFRELGQGLYEIEPGLRNLFMVGLVSRFGTARLRKVAQLLQQYTNYTTAWQAHPELEEAQRLTSLSILDPAAAARWLDDNERATSAAGVNLGREWFVAMRERMQDSPPPSATLETEIIEALRRIATAAGDIPGAMGSLVHVANLPGVDRDALLRGLDELAAQPSGTDVARAAAALRARLAPDEPEIVTAPEADQAEPAAASELGELTPRRQFSVVPITIDWYQYLRTVYDTGDRERAVLRALRRVGGVEQPWEVPPERRVRTAVTARLNEWVSRTDPGSSALVLIGRSEIGREGAWFAGVDSSPSDTGIGAAALADALRVEGERRTRDNTAWALVLVEGPQAHELVNDVATRLQETPYNGPPRLAVIGLSGDTERLEEILAGVSGIAEIAGIVDSIFAAYQGRPPGFYTLYRTSPTVELISNPDDPRPVDGVPVGEQSPTALTPMSVSTPPPAPATATGRRTTRIALCGPAGAGKTTYVAAVWLAIARGDAIPGDWTIAATTESAAEYMVDQTNLLVRERTFPPAAARTDAMSWQVSGDLSGEPRSSAMPRWLSRILPAALGGLTAAPVEFTLELHDTPGVGFRSDTELASDSYLDGLAQSDALAYLFDPLRELRSDDDDNFRYLYRMLQALTRRMHETGSLVQSRLPHQVAVCLTKFDAPEVFRLAQAGGWVTVQDGIPVVPDAQAGAFVRWLAGELGGSTRMALIMLDTYFHPKRTAYFVTSSIGFSVESGQWLDDVDGTRIHHGIRPVNVLEPLVKLERKLRTGR